MDTIDLRSDTVTHPTPEMRTAMVTAELGDDVYGDDPTVNQLQTLAAQITGKAAALFIPSGTMGNLLAIMSHCQRGDQIIIGRNSHIYRYEQGSSAVVGGTFPCTIDEAPDGTLPLAEIRENISHTNDPHRVNTRLIAVENTHNNRGGKALPIEYMQVVGELARQHNLKLHLDGARLFNAAAALGVPAAEICAPVDSVTFCLSKALCAPVGSVLCGDADFIQRAHRARKLLGGGMRQAGVLAAAGIVALQTLPQHLPNDHANAKELANGLTDIPGLHLDPDKVQTNMIFFDLDPTLNLTGNQLAELLKPHGILIGGGYLKRIRLVTHFWIKPDHLPKIVAAIAQIVAAHQPA